MVFLLSYWTMKVFTPKVAVILAIDVYSRRKKALWATKSEAEHM